MTSLRHDANLGKLHNIDEARVDQVPEPFRCRRCMVSFPYSKSLFQCLTWSDSPGMCRIPHQASSAQPRTTITSFRALQPLICVLQTMRRPTSTNGFTKMVCAGSQKGVRWPRVVLMSHSLVSVYRKLHWHPAHAQTR